MGLSAPDQAERLGRESGSAIIAMLPDVLEELHAELAVAAATTERRATLAVL